MSLPADVTTLARGAGTRTCALTASGRVYCWGRGPNGDGTAAQRTVPVVVSGIDDALEVAQADVLDAPSPPPGILCVRRRAGGAGEVWCLARARAARCPARPRRR